MHALPIRHVDLTDGTHRNLMILDEHLATRGNGTVFYWTIDAGRIAQIREVFDQMLVRAEPHVRCPDTIAFEDLTLDRGDVRDRALRDASLRGLREHLDRSRGD